jgi:hypothetical protein
MFPQSKPDFQVFRACPLDPVTVLGMDKLMWVGFLGFLEPVPYQSLSLPYQSLSLIRGNPEELAFRACLFAGTAWQLE